MYFDGSLNIDSAGTGVLFISLTREQLYYVLRIYFPTSNNTVEYEACLHSLGIAIELGIKCLFIYYDSALVINQLNKDWDTTSDKMDTYCKESFMVSSIHMWSGIKIKQLMRCQS